MRQHINLRDYSNSTTRANHYDQPIKSNHFPFLGVLEINVPSGYFQVQTQFHTIYPIHIYKSKFSFILVMMCIFI
jgi:hypothetical protein